MDSNYRKLKRIALKMGAKLNRRRGTKMLARFAGYPVTLPHCPRRWRNKIRAWNIAVLAIYRRADDGHKNED